MKLLSKLRAFGGLTLPTSIAPTPASGEYAVYFKSDGLPYYKGSDGVEVPFKDVKVSPIPNASFEEWDGDKPVNWVSAWRDVSAIPYAWTKSTDRVDGLYSWRTDIPAAQGGDGRAGTAEFAVSSGDVVTISFAAKANTTSQNPRVTVNCLTNLSSHNPDYYSGGDLQTQGADLSISTSWTKKTISLIVPTGHSRARVYLNPWKFLATAATQIYIDNVEIDITSSNSQDSRKVGEVTSFYGAKTSVMEDWLVMDGSTFDAEEYPLLAVLLGGNVLPNATDRFLIGAGNKAVASMGGSATANVSAHTHGSGSLSVAAHNVNDDEGPNTGNRSRATQGHHTVSGSTASGGAQTLNIQNPYLAVWHCIKGR